MNKKIKIKRKCLSDGLLLFIVIFYVVIYNSSSFPHMKGLSLFRCCSSTSFGRLHNLLFCIFILLYTISPTFTHSMYSILHPFVNLENVMYLIMCLNKLCIKCHSSQKELGRNKPERSAEDL